MTNTLDWRAAVWAGLTAGLVFMVLEMLLVQLFGDGTMWGPPRMIAAIVLGRDVLPPPATFAAGVFVAAMVVHFVLSLAYAFIFGWIVSRWQLTVTGAATDRRSGGSISGFTMRPDQLRL
jgi:hypothetical protein